MRYYCTPTRTANIWNTDNTKCWQGWGAIGTHSLLVGLKNVQPLWKTVWQFLIKLNILLPYIAAITLLVINLKELNTFVHTKSCTQMSVAVYPHLPKHGSHQDVLQQVPQINKLWHIQSMKYYSVLKRNELLSHEKTWKDFKWMLRSEISQSVKATYYISTIGKRQNYGNKKIICCQGIRVSEEWISITEGI